MGQEENVNAKLTGLLQRLETLDAEGYARASFRGRALSKSADSLHLAIDSGVVAIPFDTIEDTGPISAFGSQDLIWVDVRNASRVKVVRQASEHGLAQPEGRTGTSEPFDYDTATRSRGELDMCDDHKSGTIHD